MDEEWETVKIIIANFQKVIVQKYFHNSLNLPKSKYIDGEIYFMYLLQGYLEENQCNHSFLGYDMHKETISRENYGSWGGQLYDATYALTDFALIYHKLFYIAYMSCKESKAFNSIGNCFNNEAALEEIIDSRRISVSHM